MARHTFAVKTASSDASRPGFFACCPQARARTLSSMPDTTISKTEILAKLNAARTRLKNMKMDTEDATRRAVHTTMTIGGGAIVGVMRGMGGGKLPGTEVEYDTAVAAALAIVGILDGAGDYSDELGAVGAGMGAAIVAGPVEEAIRDMREKK